MAITGLGMRDAVFNALFNAGKFGSMTEGELSEVKANMLLAEKARVDYIVANMEIKGITVEVPSLSHIIAVSGGSGSPAVGTPNPAPETHTQNNDGTGRVF